MFDWVLKTPLQNTYGSLSAKIVTDFPKKYWNSFFSHIPASLWMTKRFLGVEKLKILREVYALKDLEDILPLFESLSIQTH